MVATLISDIKARMRVCLTDLSGPLLTACSIVIMKLDHFFFEQRQVSVLDQSPRQPEVQSFVSLGCAASMGRTVSLTGLTTL